MSKILYIQYTNPAGYPPLEHSSRLLADNGWDVQFLGVVTPGTEALVFPEHVRITTRLLDGCVPGWRQKVQYLRYCLWVFCCAMRRRPSWVYASDLFSCMPSLLLSFMPGVKILYHEHDTPAEMQESLFMRLCMWARRRLAHRAILCVLPNEDRAEYFARLNGIEREKVLCVWNCPMVEEVPEPYNNRTDTQMSVLFQGSIVPDRLPASVVTALKSLPDEITLDIIGYETSGSKGYVSYLKNLADELGVGSRLHYVGIVPGRDEFLAKCRLCDIGLSFMPLGGMDINMNYMTGASNKPFDYLACELPLLVSDLPDWKRMYVEPGYGIACDPDNSESIAAALTWYFEHPEERKKMGEAGRQRILSEWNYERQFRPVFDLLSADRDERILHG